MFKVSRHLLGRARAAYQTGTVLEKGTPVFAIELDKDRGVQQYFTFSYTSERQAQFIAEKLSNSDFLQEANRTDNVQFTLVSEFNRDLES